MRDWILRRSPRGEFLLVTFVAFALFIVSSAVAVLRHDGRFEMTTAHLASGIVYEMTFLGIACWILHLRGWNLARLGLEFSPGAALAGLPLMLAYLLLYWFTLLTIASFVPNAHLSDALQVRWLAPLPLTVTFLILNSVYEELLVTGYVITALEHEGAAVAITVSTLLRFSYHLYQGPVAALTILPMGLLFGTVYWRSRSLWPLMVAHTLVNLFSVLASGHQRA